MRIIQTEIILHAAIEDIWHMLIHIEQWSAWNPFIINATGNLCVGSTLTNTILNNGKQVTFQPVITALIPQKKLAWRGSAFAGGLVGRHYFVLNALSKHQVKLTQGEVFSGWLAWLIFPLIKQQTQAGFIAMNNALSDALNSSQGARATPTDIVLGETTD